MAKMTLEHEVKHHILEVDGIEYEIPQRTAALDEKLREHDSKIAERSEYESNMNLLEIIFGAKSAKTMFPDGKQTNLDKLAKCVKMTLALFSMESNEIRNEEMKKKLESVKPVMDIVSEMADGVQKASNLSIKKNGKRK